VREAGEHHGAVSHGRHLLQVLRGRCSGRPLQGRNRGIQTGALLRARTRARAGNL